MNTKNDWKTTAKILDKHRRAIWISIFPDAIVPIKSMLTQRVNVPGFPRANAYMLDLDAISDEQREGVIKMLARHFDVSIEMVRSELDQGVPILADGVVVSSSDQGIMFSMIDDNLPFERDDSDEEPDRYLDYEED